MHRDSAKSIFVNIRMCKNVHSLDRLLNACIGARAEELPKDSLQFHFVRFNEETWHLLCL